MWESLIQMHRADRHTRQNQNPPLISSRLPSPGLPWDFLLTLLLLGLPVCAATAETEALAHPAWHSKSIRRPVQVSQVKITGGFWGPKLKTYREKTIPHAWNYLRREIEDNEIAAGWRHESRGEDTPWNQANLHKALEAAAYALAQEKDEMLAQKMDSIIKAIAGAQQPDGYVNALITVRHKQPWTNLDGQHEGYVAGHLMEAAVAHYLATGRDSFLKVAEKLALHIHRHFITEGHKGVCGHAELELALVRLYNLTGQPELLALAREWVERRGLPFNYSTDTPRSYFMDHLPIREVDDVVGHAVRTMFYLTGVAAVGLETGDPGLESAARRLWQITTTRKMYITGGVGSREADEGFGPAYDLPDKGYCESCAACGLIYYSQALFAMDGNSAAMDVVERVFYNTLLHGIALDGVSTYYRNPLEDAQNPRNNIWVCCPPCIARTLLRMPEYVYSTAPDGLYVNLYAGSEASVTVGQNHIRIAQATQYPWEGSVRLTLHPESTTPFSLYLRVPGWCPEMRVRLNGQPIPASPLANGYLQIQRPWRAGDYVELELAMPVMRMEAHPKVRELSGRVALQRGPLVYGLEALDNFGHANLSLGQNPSLQASYRPNFLGGITVISGLDANHTPFTAIPFYALANRQPSAQTVWLKQAGKKETSARWEGKLYRAMDSADLTAPPVRDEARALEIDFSQEVGRIRPLHGINAGPLNLGNTLDFTSFFQKLAPPLTRLHDCHWPNPDVVDIHAMFPDFTADPASPASYRFDRTDEYLKAIRAAGIPILFRLGESIEHTQRKYFVHPPPDPAKWAAICCQVIRHYNEGWANGFHHGIQYWEIWNEPENRPAMWSGTDEDYYRLYASTSKMIRQQFPTLKIGGPSIGYAGQSGPDGFKPSPFLAGFLSRCRQDNLPLDFFSWHCYAANPREFEDLARALRRVLDQNGFTNTESHLNEWNYLPGRDWGPMLTTSQPAARQRFYEQIGGAPGGAFTAASLLLFQDCPLDMANYYQADMQGFGLFTWDGVPKKTFHASLAFKRYAGFPQRLAVAGGIPGELYLGATQNETQTAAAILVANFKAACPCVALQLKHLAVQRPTRFSSFLIDGRHDLELVATGRLESPVIRLDVIAPAVGLVILDFGP